MTMPSASSSSSSFFSPLPASALAQLYTNIARQATLDTPDWPRNAQFVSLLQQDDRGHIVPPRFTDGLGPVGAYALLKDNAEAQTIFRHLLQAATAKFVQDASPLYEVDDQKEWFAYQPAPETLHMCIVIFQEHPSLLKGHDEMQEIWQPLPPNALSPFVHKLANTLVQDFDVLPLRLHSIFWTPDGALIAGLVQDDEAMTKITSSSSSSSSSSFAQLRQTCTAIAQETLPIPLTTRPKQLIHVTLGRILVKPSSTRASVDMVQLMQTYNQDIFPRLVQDVHTNPAFHYGRFAVQDIYLLREILWMCNEYVELAIIHLMDKTTTINV